MRPLPVFVSTRVLFKSSIYKSTIVQPLHRTKKKTGEKVILFLLLCLLGCLFVWSLVRLKSMSQEHI